MIKRSIALVALSVAAAPAIAQQAPQVRRGLTVATGFEAGAATVSCRECSFRHRRVGTAFVRVGGAVRPNLVLSGKAVASTQSDDDWPVAFRFLMAGAQWYPRAAARWYLEGELGAGRMSLDDNKLESTSGAISVGTGYDLPVARGVSITPFLSYITMFPAEGTLGGYTIDRRVRGNVGHLGVALTWH